MCLTTSSLFGSTKVADWVTYEVANAYLYIAHLTRQGNATFGGDRTHADTVASMQETLDKAIAKLPANLKEQFSYSFRTLSEGEKVTKYVFLNALYNNARTAIDQKLSEPAEFLKGTAKGLEKDFCIDHLLC